MTLIPWQTYKGRRKLDLAQTMKENNLNRIEATSEAEREWGDHSNHLIRNMLTSDVNSWFFGTNIPGKAQAFLFYAGGGPAYRSKCDEVAANNYDGFKLS